MINHLEKMKTRELVVDAMLDLLPDEYDIALWIMAMSLR